MKMSTSATTPAYHQPPIADFDSDSSLRTTTGRASIRVAPTTINSTPASPTTPHSANACTKKLCGLEISSGASIGL